MIATLPFAAVMLSALQHATWNAIARSSPKPGDAMAAGVMASGIYTLPLLLVVGMPDRAAWPWLFAAIAINCVGIRAAMAAFNRMSFGLAYPIMRAGIPLMAVPIGIVLVREQPTVLAIIGVAMISAALLTLAVIAHRQSKGDFGALPLALFASLCGAGYVACDAMGVRLAGSTLSYIAAVSVGNAIALPLLIKLEGRKPLALFADNRKLGFGIAVISTTSFSLYVWVLSVSPVAVAAALRETSVLFATAIAALVLKERIVPMHWAAAGLAFAGIVVLRAA